MKIAVIGAGSTYTPELIEGLIKRKDSLNVAELALMDINPEKLGIVGGLANRMIEASGMDARCVLTQSLDEALTGSSYVMAQIRVGGLKARVLDEKIPLKFGLIGQETTGIGGFFKGLRTIPAIMDIAEKMKKLCPDAWLINFSNPSGMIAEAVLNNSQLKMVGLCNIAINMYKNISGQFPNEDLDIGYLGLNHLTWITHIRKDGRDYFKEAAGSGDISLFKGMPDFDFDAECLRIAGGVPCGYLRYYYYRNEMLKKLSKASKSRGEVCMEIERDLLSLYKDSSLSTKPEILQKRGGAMYSEAAVSFVDSLVNGKNDMHVLNIKNKGALKFMAYDDVVELPATVSAGNVEPVPVADFENNHIIAMMRMVKAYEKHAVKAALNGDCMEAARAMAIHPLIGDFRTAAQCFEEMLMAHRDYLPQFFN